jgi:hypothetical protein
MADTVRIFGQEYRFLKRADSKPLKVHEGSRRRVWHVKGLDDNNNPDRILGSRLYLAENNAQDEPRENNDFYASCYNAALHVDDSAKRNERSIYDIKEGDMVQLITMKEDLDKIVAINHFTRTVVPDSEGNPRDSIRATYVNIIYKLKPVVRRN